MEKNTNRGGFASKFGAIAAATGSAIGLGNIWRFPYVAGENGGAAFILIYLVIVFLIGLPMMLSEFTIGRYTNRNVFGAFRVLKPRGKWYLIGVLGLGTAFMILSFYCVVAGWTLNSLVGSVLNRFSGQSAGEITDQFNHFVATGWMPVIWAIIFTAATGYIVIAGVEKGIERYNKILMPMMVVILVIMGINSFTLDGIGEGLAFLFKPDFSKITGSVVLEALGQAFFSLSLGMGTMITYGSYIRSTDNMSFTAGSVAISDTLIAILAGIAIFPAVFSFGISPTSGPDLVFITLPNIFQQMPGGYFLSVLFFLLLFIAAITSSVSIMEVLVAYGVEELKLSRRKAGSIVSLVIMGTATLCAVSQMPGSGLRVLGNSLFDFADTATSNYTMPLGAFFITLFTGWFFGYRKIYREFTSGGNFGKRIFPLFIFIVRFVAPVVIAIIFLTKAGLIKL